MLLVFLIFWIIFNGQLTWEIFWFGLVISAVLYLFMCKYLDYSFKKDVIAVKRIGYVLRYILILFIEIVKANITSMTYMLSEKKELEPALVHFKSPVSTEFGKFVLANSITLTPGTITVEQDDDDFVVHCLDRDMIDGLVDGIFVKEIRKIENLK